MEKQKLIYVESKALFSPSSVSNKAIVFIKDTKEIWTHGTYFICSNIWTTPITLTLSGDSTGSVSIDGSGNVTLLVSNKFLTGTDGITDANNAVLATYNKVSYYPHIPYGSTNLFPASYNANAILTLNTHDYTYNHQLGFSSNKGIYHRTRAAGNWETSWREILTSTNYTNYPHTFASLTNKPTTISGYGITDSIPIIKGGEVTANTDLSTLGMTTAGYKFSVSYGYESYPSWLMAYTNVLMFRANSDSYGAIGIEMMGDHRVLFMGGRNAETSKNNVPNWWFRIKGSSSATYDLNSFLNVVNNSKNYVTINTDQAITSYKIFKATAPEDDREAVYYNIGLKLTSFGDNHKKVAAIGMGNEPQKWYKAAIGFERTGTYDRGDIVFLFNNSTDFTTCAYSDIKVRINAAGNINTLGTVSASGFKKTDSSDSYVLLGGGGHKLLSELSGTHTHPWTDITLVPKILPGIAKAWFVPGHPFSSDLNAYISTINNRLYSADVRYTVSTSNISGPIHLLFNNNYDNYCTIAAGTTGTITIEGFNWIYPTGYIFISFYNTAIPQSAKVTITYNRGNNTRTIGRSPIEPNGVWAFQIGINYLTKIEIQLTAPEDNETRVTLIDYSVTRTDNNQRDTAIVTNYTSNTLLYQLTAPKYIVKNGTSSLFLKADGSLDSSNYYKIGTELPIYRNVHVRDQSTGSGIFGVVNSGSDLVGGSDLTTVYSGTTNLPYLLRTSADNLYHYNANKSSRYLILDTNNYLSYALPLSGGTMTGALNFKNATWNKVGDDAYMGDCNVGGMIGIKGSNADTPGFAMYNSAGTLLGKLYASSTSLYWSNTKILTASGTSTLFVMGDSSLYSDTVSYTTWDKTTTSGIAWFPIASIINPVLGSALFIVRAYAHSSIIFTVTSGHSTGNINVLAGGGDYNAGFAYIMGVRLIGDFVELGLNAAATNVNIVVKVLLPTFTHCLKSSLVESASTTTPYAQYELNTKGNNFNFGIVSSKFTGNLIGNADTASKWVTARTITLTGDVTGSVSLDGSSNVTLTTATSGSGTSSFLKCLDKRNSYPALIVTSGGKVGAAFVHKSMLGGAEGTWYDAIILRGYVDDSAGNENALLFSKNTSSVYHSLYAFGSTTTWGTLYKFLDSGNYKNYAPSLSGEGATGTWGINISGTANKVANALTLLLNGGTTSGTNKFVYDGAAAYTVNITPASIGAATSSHNHDNTYLKLTGGTISSSSYGPLVIERSGSSTLMAAIKFKNASGDLGSIGIGSVNGDLLIYNAGISAYRTILDSGNSSISENTTNKTCTIKINGTSKTVSSSTHNHDGSYLKLSGGTLGNNSASVTELRTLSSTAALRIMSYSDSTNYILSGNSSFDGNATLRITGYSNVTGTNLYFKFNNIYCRGNDYINIDSGNYGSYALPLSGGTMTGTINCKAIVPITDNGYSIGTSSKTLYEIHANFFKRRGSSNDYILLGGGEHKLISDFVLNYTAVVPGGSVGNNDSWTLILNNNYSTGWYNPCTMFYIRSHNFGCGILCFYHYWDTSLTSGYYDNSVWFFGAEHSAYSSTMGGTGRDINNFLKVYIDKDNDNLKIYYNRYNNLSMEILELLFSLYLAGTLYPEGLIRASHFITNGAVTDLPITSNTFVNIPILTVKNHTEDIKTTRSVYASAFYENSDIRLKENVHSIDLIDLLKNVDLVLFNFKNDLNKKYGVIAQQLEQVGLNNLVYEHNGNKAVDYISLLVLETLRLRNEIKELKEKLDKNELSS